MKVIVGLGNYGKEYERTRHNIGFMALDRIAADFGFESFRLEKGFEAEISSGMIASEKTLLVKPQTYMNASGRAVQKVLGFYKLATSDLIVIHDDLDIRLGDIRTTKSSRAAGHKGVQSIIDIIGTQDFCRVRVGIGIEDRKIPTEKYVLTNFTREEEVALSAIMDTLGAKIEKELI